MGTDNITSPSPSPPPEDAPDDPRLQRQLSVVLLALAALVFTLTLAALGWLLT